MATTEERMKILQMIQEGKISAEEGGKLLSALAGSAKQNHRKRAPVPRPSGGARWLHVPVTDAESGKSKVNANLPPSLVEAGLNIARLFAEDIEVEDIMGAVNEAINENLSGKIIDLVDSEDGEHVEIFIE